jgi:hypothetical protein
MNLTNQICVITYILETGKEERIGEYPATILFLQCVLGCVGLWKC